VAGLIVLKPSIRACCIAFWQIAFSIPVMLLRVSAPPSFPEMLFADDRNNLPEIGSVSIPKVVSIHENKVFCLISSMYSVSVLRILSTDSFSLVTTDGLLKSNSVVRRCRYSPITFSGSTLLPKSSVATLEISRFCSRRSPELDKVADVPMQITFSAFVASIVLLISIATSAPCRPR